MTCPEREQLQHLLEGSLPAAEVAELSHHLESCETCQLAVEALTAENEPASVLARRLNGGQEAAGPGLEQAVAQLKADVPHTENRPTRTDDLPLDFLTPSEKPGQLGKLGHYDVTEFIGRGGMGIVLKAFDEKLHRVVAIKVMAPELAANATARKRFVREAQAAAAIRNDHVIAIYAVEDAPSPYPLPRGGEGSGLPYLVMEYISGESLQERLDKSGPLELKEILRIGMQTANGLAAAHAQGLVHRDIKPANILMENGVERVKITDFGLARAVDDASISQSGIVAGTPQFMAPEQARGEHLDHRADLFSLGSMLYAMCTGRAPFRAANTVAVLRRVSEDTPRLITEINPDIPDWLVAIVDKLHAKEPEDRYQTAAEVAELLGRHLAQLQQPSLVPLPTTPPVSPPSQGGERKVPPSQGGDRQLSTFSQGGEKLTAIPPLTKGGIRGGRRRWAIAAAVLLVLIGSLVITEATGVTKITDFVATTLRITTPEGTLIVEVDDPNVKVTIEGDGGLVITGAGPQEVRLKPGSYKVEASKDGKPVKSEVVTITRGDKQVVKVQIEGPSAGSAGRDEKQPFVILGRKGVEVRKYDTLAEAVQGASDGDTIEVRGNGPFVTKAINLGKTALTIRAGAGFRPVIKLSPADHQALSLLRTDAPLVLEGLELQRVAQEPGVKGEWWVIVYSFNAPLYAANCRFIARQLQNCISSDSPVCELRNCEILSPESSGVVWGNAKPGARLVIDNCVQASGQIIIAAAVPDAKEPNVFQLRRNTCLSHSLRCGFELDKWQGALKGDERTKVLRVEASGNVLDASATLFDWQIDKVAPDSETVAFLTHRVDWRGESNVFLAASGSFLSFGAPGKAWEPTIGIKSLADWKKFWGSAEAGSIEAQPRYQGGDLRSKLREAPEKLTPDDFRLRPDSAGYRAGKDGKDLGADVDLVGPGAAYERWKKTPEYQLWLKDTGQLRAEAPKPEPKAFVVLGGKGVAERKFDTLAEAVQNASDGDTIEIRGNGPFVSQPISIQRTALTIRAGDGYRPVIKLSPEANQRDVPLLKTNAALVLEGLELYRAPRGDQKGRVLDAMQAPLRAANCRFRASMAVIHAPVCVFRNCEFLAENAQVAAMYIPGARVTFENCLHRTTGGAIGIGYDDAALRDVSIQIRGSTFVSRYTSLWLPLDSPLPLPSDPAAASKPIRLEVSGSIFDAPVVLGFGQDRKFLDKAAVLDPAQAEVTLLRLLEWRGERNLFAAGSTTVSWFADGKQQPPRGPKTLGEWKRFWGGAETDSLEGSPRFQGGNLLSRPETALDQLTPDDFRLRADSAGYRAGKDGKDLGADVDLVGPGAAYERWKKTPEYQQWLKDTGQLRAEAPKPEPKAFVVLGGQGVAERKYDTLAEAVAAAHDGDIIEIRGHGPFVTQPISIKQALTMRAGEGFRPVIKADKDEQGKSLLSTNAPLVLEGLDLQWVDAKASDPADRSTCRLVVSNGPTSRLDVANCRFLMNRRDGGSEGMTCIAAWETPLCHLRNCQFLVGAHGTLHGTSFAFTGIPHSEVMVDNCLMVGHGVNMALTHAEPMKVVLNRNTSLGSLPQCVSFYLAKRIDPPLGEKDPRPLQMETSANILGGPVVFNQHADFLAKEKALNASEAEQLLTHLVGWRENRNLYFVSDDSDLLRLSAEVTPGRYTRLPPTVPTKTLADWQRFWGLAEIDSERGQAKFQGGDLLAKALTPQLLTPEDFRLRPDSAGYRAGPDGKDLGADVDLVGPGAAYERWKKTPEYQQWLKDTGQGK